jgi:FAD synthase
MQEVTLQGTITRFNGNGRRLGYPTANIMTDTSAKDGVYFGFADLAGFKHHPSLIFIGVPTTMGDTERRAEVHLLDIPDEDYYDQTLAATLKYYHRANQAFKDVAELLIAMKADEAAARQWFAKVAA